MNTFAKISIICFLVLVFIVPSCCLAENKDGYIANRYSEFDADNVLLINKNLDLSEQVKCEVTEAALIGDHLLQVLHFTPVHGQVFLYPLGSVFKMPTVTYSEAMESVIGELVNMSGMPDDAYGKTVSEYLKQNNMSVLLFDQMTTVSAKSNQFSKNEWEMQPDGSVVVYTWVWPVDICSEIDVTVKYAEYTEEQLDSLAESGKRFSTASKAEWQLSPSVSTVNIPESYVYSGAGIWESKDSGIQLKVGKAELQLLPEFTTLTCSITLSGAADTASITAKVLLDGVIKPMSDFIIQNDDIAEIQLYCIYPRAASVPKSVTLSGTVCGQKFEIPLSRETN